MGETSTTPEPKDCKPGCQQSPIVIKPTITSKTPLDLKLYSAATTANVPASAARSRSTDASTAITLRAKDPKNKIELEGTTYFLDSAHFHRPGEHQFPDAKGKNVPYDAEMHFVYKTADLKKIAVIGIQFKAVPPIKTTKIVAKPTPLETQLDELASAFASQKAGTVSLNTRDWIPGEPTVVRYEGSLTTSPWDETVSWIVMTVPYPVPSDKIDAVFPNPHSARAVQNLNRRYVVGYVLSPNWIQPPT